MNTLRMLVRRSLFPLGSVATIRRGPLRGCLYRVTEESGWAPILGRLEPDALRAYTRLVLAGDNVWDLGANTGIHALLFARLAGAKGSVAAFEPLHVNAEQIRETCRLNAVDNLRVVEKAVSDTCDSAMFHIGVHHKQGGLVGIGQEEGTRIEVPCTTMDAALAECGAPDFVKIDIEGAESRALRGFTRVAESHPTFAIDLHTPSEDVAVGAWLRENGYSAFRLLDATARAHGASTRELDPIVDLGHGWPVQSGIWGTVIAVHPSRPDVLERARSGG